MSSSYIDLEQDVVPPSIDRSSSWVSFLHPLSGRYGVPDLLKEKDADIPRKMRIILGFLAFSDEFVSPVDITLLFHVHMLDVSVNSCNSWDCWLRGVDNWLRGVARRLDKKDMKYLFMTVVNHASQWFVPFLYGAFQRSSGVGTSKQKIAEFLESRYDLLLKSEKPVVQIEKMEGRYWLEMRLLFDRKAAYRPPEEPPNGIKFMKLVLDEIFEDESDLTNSADELITAESGQKE
ncbi:hypothetical protein F4809DRAFT_666729 [Biscogniauxia mediterranea]|nr:hypothetical protein F4809DRAFT_666729 [Biscogniauxia mediterranea]